MFDVFLVVAAGLLEEKRSSSSCSDTLSLFLWLLLLLLFHGLFSERDNKDEEDADDTRCKYDEGVYRNPAVVGSFC